MLYSAFGIDEFFDKIGWWLRKDERIILPHMYFEAPDLYLREYSTKIFVVRDKITGKLNWVYSEDLNNLGPEYEVVVEFLLVRVKTNKEEVVEVPNLSIDIVAVVRPIDGPDKTMHVSPYQYINNKHRYELVDVTYEDRKDLCQKREVL